MYFFKLATYYVIYLSRFNLYNTLYILVYSSLTLYISNNTFLSNVLGMGNYS